MRGVLDETPLVESHLPGNDVLTCDIGVDAGTIVGIPNLVTFLVHSDRSVPFVAEVMQQSSCSLTYPNL